MNKLLLGSMALAAMIAGPATAADMPVKAPVYKAPPPALYSWTGCYLGVNAGYAWNRADSRYTDDPNAANDPLLGGRPLPINRLTRSQCRAIQKVAAGSVAFKLGATGRRIGSFSALRPTGTA